MLIDFIKKYGLKKVIALPEETGLIISSEGKKIIGRKSAYIFRDGQKSELKIGEQLE